MDHMGRYECKFQTHASAVDRVFNVKVDGELKVIHIEGFLFSLLCVYKASPRKISKNHSKEKFLGENKTNSNFED